MGSIGAADTAVGATFESPLSPVLRLCFNERPAMNGRAPKEIEAEKSDLGGVIAVLRRRAGLIVLCVVIATVGAVGFSLAQEKEYSASASLLFRNPGFAESLF